MKKKAKTEQLLLDFEKLAANEKSETITTAAAIAETEKNTAAKKAEERVALDPASVHQLQGPLKILIDNNFLQYASYVIRDRAIPDLADGLKPVQRRILFSLHEKDDGKFIKVANIVGYCMQYHPHGDASIGDALVTLANKRYLIEGQGNFGNIFTGDSAAASRYIECRLTELARRECFNDALTAFVPSYDGRNKEPVVLPVKIPLLLMLGAEGIAVGLSTRILPHNFIELLEAQIAILQNKRYRIMPDFEQGGLMDISEYNHGKGKIRLRAVIDERDEDTLVIRAIPYGTTTDSLINSIEDAARKKKIKIKSISDYTAAKIEIVISLASGESAEKAIQSLYAFTECEISLNSNIIVIHEQRPVEMTVDEILQFNTKTLTEILKKELEHERGRLLDEFHAKTLAQIFIEKRIYKDIEECKTYDDVQQTVIKGVNRYRKMLKRDVTTEDVEMLLELRIKRISRFDINKNRKDIEQILLDLDTTEKHLKELVPYTIRYLKELIKKYGEMYPRRTKVSTFGEVEVRALSATEISVFHDVENGYIGTDVKSEIGFKCSSLDKIILVWDDGRYKMIPAPEKLFVDKNLVYCGRYDRDAEIALAYTHEKKTYLKRFTFGGAIMNKTYQCAPEGSKVQMFSDQPVPELYVRYTPSKGQRVHQQIFHPAEVLVKNVKARGVRITDKAIRGIYTQKPRSWEE